MNYRYQTYKNFARTLCLCLAIFLFVTLAHADITTGLVSHWKFNEGTGTTAADSAGSNNGTLVNGTAWTSGLFDSALDFDGTDDHVNAGSDAVNSGSDFTFAAWVHADTGTSDLIMDERNAGFVGVFLEVGFEGTGIPAFGMRDGSISLKAIGTSSIVGDWHHVAGVWNQTTRTAQLYVDGVLVDTETNLAFGSSEVDDQLGIGVQSGGTTGGLNGTSHFDGIIDDVRIYDRALTGGDVGELANPPSPGGVDSDLKLWLKADAGVTGSPVTAWADHSIQRNNTTGFNSPTFVSNGINFNPAINLNPATGGGQFFRTTNTGIIGSNNAYTKIAVIKMEGTSELNNIISGAAHAFWGGQIGGNNDLSLWHSGNFLTSTNTLVAERPQLISGRYGAGTNPNNILVDGTSVASEAATTRNFADNDTTQIGRHVTNVNTDYDGHVAEAIIYKGYLSNADLNKVNSYLALKYGITLSHNYLDSAATILWDVTVNSTYSNNITGIGRDDASALSQKQSKSSNTTGIVTIGHGSIAATNAANSNNFSTDKTFMVVGHDNASATAWTPTGAPTNYERIARTWHVEETGTVGNTTISFNVANTNADIPEDEDGYYLLRDSDNDNSLTDETPILLHDDGTNGDVTASDNQYSVNTINFADGEEFTLATFAAEYGVEVIPVVQLTSESGDTGSFQIELLAEPTASVTIALTSSNTAEGTVPASIVIQPENWNVPTANVVTVTGVDDDPDIADGAVEYTIITGDVTSTDTNFNLLTGADVADVTMTNQNNDPPGVSISVVDNTTGEDLSTARVRFTLLAQPATMDADVVVALSISDGTEGSIVPASITIDFDNWNNAAANEITVTGVNDDLDDGNIVYELVTGEVTSTDPGYEALVGADVADASLTNTDDDGPGVQVTETAGSTAVTEGGAADSFTLRLGSQPAPGSFMVLDLDPPAGLDLGSGSGVAVQLTFDNDDWNQTQSVNVTAPNNALLDGTRTPNISISTDHDATTEDSYDHLDIPSVAVTVTDDDTATADLSVTQHGDETGLVDIIYTVTLSVANNTGSTITFDINPSGGIATVGSDYDDFAGETISVASGSSEGTFTVSVVDDAINDDDETVQATISNSSSSLVTIGTATATATITDNDSNTRSSSSGSTVQSRVKNLTDMGNTEAANALKNEWSHLFSGNSSVPSSPSTTPSSSTCSNYTFTRNLRMGDEGEDVRALQQLLNCFGFALAESGPGAPGEETILFRDRTHAAVIKFQEHYAQDVLVPLNLTKGTGYFAEMTRKKMEEIINQ